MNERLKELAEQAGLSREFAVSSLWLADDEELKHFAELVRQDERNSIRQSNRIDVTDLVLRAKAEEREACAMLCEEWYLSGDVAKAIRARGEPSPAFKNYMGDNWAGIV
jgi:hypothetical protein